MNNRLIAGLLAAAVLGAASTIPAQASCRGAVHCKHASISKTHTRTHAHTHAHPPAKKASALKKRKHTAHHASVKTKKRVHVAYGSRTRSFRRTMASAEGLAIPVQSGAQGNVISLIKSMAPAQGVPTWFALRIAHVESNYNPHLRGAAGEYGVFQMKCATAKGIGFRGNCGQLLDARTNVQWGLRHLAIAIGMSDGNLRLAASKHNGGLGRKRLVPTYVAKVF